MPTHSQIHANRENAKFSTGPTSEAGKAVSALNNTRHGLTGAFRVLPTESQEEFDQLFAAFRDEHKPATMTEDTLVEAMAQHQWLRRRALNLESSCYDPATGEITNEKQLALSLRYQTTHERAFHKCLNDLLKLRAQKRKTEIGFESQKRKQAEETRKHERHEMKKEFRWLELENMRDQIEYRQDREMIREIKESARKRAELRSGLKAS